MLELIALSQTAPGPIAVSTALLTGYKLKGATWRHRRHRRGDTAAPDHHLHSLLLLYVVRRELLGASRFARDERRDLRHHGRRGLRSRKGFT